MLVSVIQRDLDNGLPDRLDRCVLCDLSAGLPVPAWPAVAVLIRSLSTNSGVTHHSPVVAVLSQAGTDPFSTHEEAPSPCLQNLSITSSASTVPIACRIARPCSSP